MNEAHFAVQCNGEIKRTLNRCGRWVGIKTTNLQTAKKTCPICGKTLNPRGKHGWLLNYKFPKANQPLEELVQDLNYQEGLNEKR